MATAVVASPASFPAAEPGIGRVLAAAAAGAIVWWAPFHLAPPIQHALGVTAFMVIAWVTCAIDHALTGFIGCYLFWALKIARFPSRLPASPTARRGS